MHLLDSSKYRDIYVPTWFCIQITLVMGSSQIRDSSENSHREKQPAYVLYASSLLNPCKERRAKVTLAFF